MEAITTLERQRARAIAEEYRSRGYEVIEAPTPEQLPDFISGYDPALLIRKGKEAIVVEVKSRSSLAKDSRIRDLARLLQTKPNWNFELVVVGEEENVSPPEGARPFEREDILRGIEEAERLFESGFSEAALLLAWSTLEATLRVLAEEEGLSLDRLTPTNILKQVVIHGVISRNDYSFLMNVMKYRNALAHGFKTTEFDSALIRDLIITTKRLLKSTTVP
jgi:REase_AHJR-like protein